MSPVRSLSFIWHFPFHNALCYTEQRILLSCSNYELFQLWNYFSGEVRERLQNNVSNGIYVTPNRVQVILGGIRWKHWNGVNDEFNVHEIFLDAQMKVVAALFKKKKSFSVLRLTRPSLACLFFFHLHTWRRQPSQLRVQRVLLRTWQSLASWTAVWLAHCRG